MKIEIFWDELGENWDKKLEKKWEKKSLGKKQSQAKKTWNSGKTQGVGGTCLLGVLRLS